ncbi:hypothetical protein KP77_25450 [Jeotgalibacillus alimentarius]|uniref:Uncharacterized protein n=1 Tax=Jeotgalibacillus alimentarius TaxID=135826 RepID=A0A0C2VRA5_9BACL|nr:hypothetical protein [Jeotgalibacillus alimentarius]KIL46976.1 hypothetical protein KP77_25450 [Jeotgalibacillus alimentarius]
MSFDYKGQRVYEPSPNDTETNHFHYQWLKKYEATLGGSAPYEEMLEEYETTRIQWEMERLRSV